MANIPQRCWMFDLDSCWLSLQMPLEQEIDNDAKQMANQSRRGTWWCGVWTHVCQHCSYDDLHFNDTLTQSLNNKFHTIAQSYWLIEIAQQKDWHAHFEFQLMICDTTELQSVQKFHRIQWIHWNSCSSTSTFFCLSQRIYAQVCVQFFK